MSFQTYTINYISLIRLTFFVGSLLACLVDGSIDNKPLHNTELNVALFIITLYCTWQFGDGCWLMGVNAALDGTTDVNETKSYILTLSLPESNLESINVVLTFKSVDETLVCHHSNESYWAVLLCGTVCFWQFYKMKFRIFSSVLSLALLGVKGLRTQEQWQLWWNLLSHLKLLSTHLFKFRIYTASNFVLSYPCSGWRQAK